MKADTQPSGGVDLVMGGMAVAVALGAVLWGAGFVSAWMAGHRVPHGKPLAGYTALGYFGDPSRAWSAPVGPVILYWTITLLALVVAGIVCWGGWKVWHYQPSAKGGDPALLDGMATSSQVRRAAGAKTLLKRSAALRRSLRHARGPQHAPSRF